MKHVILRVHIFLVETTLAAKQNECGVYFSIVHTKKVPFHNVQSCFTICVVSICEPTCVVWLQNTPIIFMFCYCQNRTCCLNTAYLFINCPYLHETAFNNFILCAYHVNYAQWCLVCPLITSGELAGVWAGACYLTNLTASAQPWLPKDDVCIYVIFV